MSLAPAVRFAVAPRFHVRADWEQRLQVNGGVDVDAHGLPLPRADWRPLTPDERALRTGPAATDSAAAGRDATLLNLPPHVRAAWWAAAERIDGVAGGGEGYQRFVAQTVELLQFKQLPLPESCAFDVRVSKPGLRSTRLEPAGLSYGLAGRRTVAWVNLGDEATHLVLADIAGAEDIGALRRLLAHQPDCPLLRLRLEPGEGLWFPPGPVAHDGDTIDKLELDVVLTLSEQDVRAVVRARN